MELRHLRYFVAVAEELHFGRAAQRLKIAQPPLSQQIQKLERELGVALFTRSRRSVQLTDAGQALLPEAQRILASTEAAADLARRAGAGEIGRLNIGLVSSALYGLLPRFLRRLYADAPGLRVTLRDLPTDHIIDALGQRSLDLGFTRGPFRDPSILTLKLSDDPFIVAFPADHPLAQDGPLDIAALEKETILSFPRELRPEIYDAIVAVCQRAGFSPILEEQDVAPHQVVLALVAAGRGVGLVPESYKSLAFPGVSYRPLLNTPISMNVMLAWHRDNRDPALTRAVRIAHELFAPASLPLPAARKHAHS
jgi:DNA-binding transcriptional LysR family regulator